MVIYSNMNPYYAEILHWINRACTESNYSTLVSYSMDSQVGDRESIERLIDRGVDGLILNITQEDETILPYLYELDIPFVLMNRHFPDLNQDTIYNDDYLGGSLAMNHLLELGHRRIGIACYLTVPSHSYVQRYAAYKDSLEIAGITFDPKLVYNCDFEKENGYKAMEYFLEMEDRPTGIFFCGDILAIGAYKSAFERGVRIPEDISLVGYDNIDYSGYMIPPLTTIDQDCKAIGNRAVENLLIRIDDENQKAQHLSIAPNLIVRNSTAKLK